MNCPGPDSVTHDRHCISIPTVTLLSLRRATRAQHVNIGLGHISDLHTSHSHASTSRGSLPVPTLVPMIQGDTNASGVWAWRQLELLSKNLPSTQEKLGSRRLDEARDLARKDEASIRPSDMKIINDKFLQCVLSLQIVSETCSTTISATEIRASLESKSGLSRFLHAREYRKFAEDLASSPVCRGHSRTSHRTGDISHYLMISRPSPTELRIKPLGRGRWA